MPLNSLKSFHNGKLSGRLLLPYPKPKSPIVIVAAKIISLSYCFNNIKVHEMFVVHFVVMEAF